LLATLERERDALHRHDLDAIMGFFAEDCGFDAPCGPDPWGRIVRKDPWWKIVAQRSPRRSKRRAGGVIMPIEIRVLGPGDDSVLQRVAPDVFDGPVDSPLSAEFLADPRHHLAVALDDGQVVAMASALHYVHPDKPPELWVNEVAVAPTHQSRGIGRQVLLALFAHARTLGCHEAWVLTNYGNAAARRMYAAAGGIEDQEAPLMITFDLGNGNGAAPDGRAGTE
jgi:GNAT superfamily N-acetyltransferase